MQGSDRAKPVKHQAHKPIPIAKQISIDPISQQRVGTPMQNRIAAPPMNDAGDLDLNKLFSGELGNESDVLKELFSSENIKVKTDLTPEQISIISRLELQASVTQNFYLARVIKELETLLVSKNRLSRQEFVRSFHGMDEVNKQATVFSKLGGIFKNDKV